MRNTECGIEGPRVRTFLLAASQNIRAPSSIPDSVFRIPHSAFDHPEHVFSQASAEPRQLSPPEAVDLLGSRSKHMSQR
jgi:hypothetical protein